VAFCICVYLFLTVYHQFSYDSFHRDGDRLFLSYVFSNDPNGPMRAREMPLPFAPALKAEFPEVEGAVRVMWGGRSLNGVAYGENTWTRRLRLPIRISWRCFPSRCLRQPQTALRELGQRRAQRKHGESTVSARRPAGQGRCRRGGRQPQDLHRDRRAGRRPPELVGAVRRPDRVENLPDYQAYKDDWQTFNHPVFVKLAPDADKAALEKRLKPFVAKYFPSTLENLEKRGAKPDAQGDVFAVRLEHISKIRVGSVVAKGPPAALLYALMGVGFFILLIACFNFINLSIARSFIRAREVGVRKTLGARKGQLFTQIWGEATLVCFIGLVTGPGWPACFCRHSMLRSTPT
jgi:hypothetical protein